MVGLLSVEFLDSPTTKSCNKTAYLIYDVYDIQAIDVYSLSISVYCVLLNNFSTESCSHYICVRKQDLCDGMSIMQLLEPIEWIK